MIAGAVVLGGLAAIIASSSSKNGRGDYDRDYDYDENYNGRSAVERCVRAAERRASRLGKARVTEVTTVDRIRRGYRVEGDIRVKERRGRDGAWREWGGNGRWDDHDRRGERQRGGFTCETRRGEIRRLDLHGLDNW